MSPYDQTSPQRQGRYRHTCLLEPLIHQNNHQVDAEHIFSILRNTEKVQSELGLVSKGTIARHMIVSSNILNKTIIDKLVHANDLIFPAKYLTAQDNPGTPENERVVNIDVEISFSSW